MFRLRKLTPARSQIRCGAGAANGFANGIFLIFIKSLSGLDLSLTCRQGDFAEDLSEEGMRDAYKMQVGPIARPRPLLVQIGRLGNGLWRAYDKIDGAGDRAGR
jgi:hypothetical protein